jgi:hypothetical protein
MTIAPTPFYIIRARDGRLWQTSRGFIGQATAEATKYSSRTEAEGVRAFCCPARAQAIIEEVRP